LQKFGPPGRTLAHFLEEIQKKERIPEARGDVRAITGEPFFLPLYDLYLTYGGIFRLTFGPKVTWLVFF
jgi:beta-ring hydroxylase